MYVFVNVEYNGVSNIVKVAPKLEFEDLVAEDYYEAVKSFYNINKKIKLYDKKMSCIVPEDILVNYVNQYRSSPGWSLGVVDDETEETVTELEFSPIVSVPEADYSQLVQSYTIEPSTTLQNNQSVIELGKFVKSTVPSRTLSCLGANEFERQTYITQLITAEILSKFSDIDFKIIYGHYKRTKKVLSNAHQIKLSKVIVKFILENNIDIELTRQDFIYLAHTICEVFNHEIDEVYYTSALNGQKPSGKLYDAFNNYRSQLCSAGLVKRRVYSKQLVASSECPVNDTDASIDFEFVKNNSGPQNILKEKWSNCLKLRQAIINDKKISTNDYLLLFPVFNLNDNVVFELFLADVKSLYSGFQTEDTWDRLYLNVLKEGFLLRNKFVRHIIDAINDCDENIKKSAAWLVLSFLFPSTVIKSETGKRGKKASKIEVQEQFIIQFDTLEKADNYERELIKTNRGDQPRIVFDGDLKNVSAYITLVEKKYYFNNPQEAVRHCMILYLALNISYPPESIMVWNYVQQYIFGVKTKYDSNSSSLKAVHHKLTNNV